MEIRRFTIVDVYFNEEDENTQEFKREHNRLIKAGYTLEHEDSGNHEYKNCNQYLSRTKIRGKKFNF